MKKIFTTICLAGSLIQLSAQNSNDKTWAPVLESSIPKSGLRQIIPQKYLTYRLNLADL